MACIKNRYSKKSFNFQNPGDNFFSEQRPKCWFCEILSIGRLHKINIFTSSVQISSWVWEKIDNVCHKFHQHQSSNCYITWQINRVNKLKLIENKKKHFMNFELLYFFLSLFLSVSKNLQKLLLYKLHWNAINCFLFH